MRRWMKPVKEYCVRVTFRPGPQTRFFLHKGNTAYVFVNADAVAHGGLWAGPVTEAQQAAYLRQKVTILANDYARDVGSPGWTTATVEGIREQSRFGSKDLPGGLRFKIMNRRTK